MIVSRIRAWAAHHPDRTAIVHNGRAFSYAWFAEAISQARRFFQPIVADAGEGVAVLLINSLFDSWVMSLALRAEGMTTIVIQSPQQIAGLALRDVKLLVATAPERSSDVLQPFLPSGARLVSVPGSVYADDYPDARPIDDAKPIGGHILYTSGTTGTYKKVLERGEIEDARNETRARAQGLSARTVHHNLYLGLWTAAGFKFPGSVWHAGGCIVLDQRPDLYRHLLDHGVNQIFALPGALADMIAERDPEAEPEPGLDVVVSGGFLPANIAMAAKQRLAGRLLAYFNSTELSVNVLQSMVASEEDLIWMRPPAGRVVEIVDDAGLPCSVDQPGELRVLRLPIDSEGYLDDPEATARMFRDGYFYPGDMAVRRADGRVRILGRTADVLNVRGQKLPAAPIEQEIRRILQVNEVCVFAGLDSAGREAVVVALEADQTPAQAARNTVAQSLHMFAAVHFAVVSAFPRTEGGMRKIRRLALRQMVWDAVENQARTT